MIPGLNGLKELRKESFKTSNMENITAADRPERIIKSVAYHIGRADAKLDIILATVNGLEIDQELKCELLRELENLAGVHNDIIRIA